MDGKKKDIIRMGRNKIQQNNTFRNKTGITALPFNEIFLVTSYKPSKVAEMKAKINHIK